MTYSLFDRWAAGRLGIPVEELRLSRVNRDLRPQRDLPAGDGSELGGELALELDDPMESEVEDLAALGDELLQELPEPPAGYVPADVDQPLAC
jgi:hypothetical protein